MTTTKTYDYLNRLTQISSAPSGASTVSFAYNYNSANQRIRCTLADGSYWLYDYDKLGQVKRGARYWSDGTPVAGQQFVYGFDDIGNRTQTEAGGDQNGGNLRSASYSANMLNQYTSRDVPGAFDVIGLAMGNNSALAVRYQQCEKVRCIPKIWNTHTDWVDHGPTSWEEGKIGKDQGLDGFVSPEDIKNNLEANTDAVLKTVFGGQ